MIDYKVYEVIDRAERKPEGKIVDTREVKKAKFIDGKRTCRVRFVGRDYKWLDPHAVGLFAPTTGCSTQRLVDFFAVRFGHPTLTADVPAAFLHTPIPDDMLLYCYPPKAWVEEDALNRSGKLWRLLKVLPGMREGRSCGQAILAETERARVTGPTRAIRTITSSLILSRWLKYTWMMSMPLGIGMLLKSWAKACRERMGPSTKFMTSIFRSTPIL